MSASPFPSSAQQASRFASSREASTAKSPAAPGTSGGVGRSPSSSSLSSLSMLGPPTHTNSPAAFASLVAAAGGMAPPPRQSRTQPGASASGSTPAAAAAAAGLGGGASAGSTAPTLAAGEDPYEGLIASTRTFQQLLTQLEMAGQTFLAQYNGALGPGHGASCEAVQESLERVLESIDGALRFSSRNGLAGLDVSDGSKAESVERRCEMLSDEARDTFERRERLRESAGVVRAILTKGRG